MTMQTAHTEHIAHTANHAKTANTSARQVPHVLAHPTPVTALSPHWLEQPQAIGLALHAVQRAQSPVTLFSDGAPLQNTSLGNAIHCGMGLIAQIDDAHATLRLNVSVAQPPADGILRVVSRLTEGEYLQWHLQGHWERGTPGHCTLQAAWPLRILQHQRRRYPRVQLPLGQNHEASFMFGRRRCALQLEDISAGGVGLRGAPQETDMLFMGRQIADAVLDLGHAQVQVNLTVRSRRRYQSFLLGTQVMVGCSVEGDTPALQAALAQVAAQRST